MPSKSPVPILQRLPHLRTVELESPTAGGTGAHFQVVMRALCCAPLAERSSNRIDRVGSPEVSELFYRAIARRSHVNWNAYSGSPRCKVTGLLMTNSGADCGDGQVDNPQQKTGEQSYPSSRRAVSLNYKLMPESWHLVGAQATIRSRK